MLSGTRAAIALKIFGPDLYELRDAAERVRAAVEDIDGVVDLQVEQQSDVPQLRIHADRAAMARFGVTPGRLAEAVDVALNGEVVSQVLEGQSAFDLVVRYPDELRDSQGEDRDGACGRARRWDRANPLISPTYASSGDPTQSVARTLQRKIVVQANVEGRDVGSVVDDIREHVRGRGHDA